MTNHSPINKQLALFLANCCLQTYNQLSKDGVFDIPLGYQLVKAFKAKALGNLEWFGFIIQGQGNTVIAFRGTQSWEDWFDDAELSQVPYPYANAGRTHLGFTTVYSSCREEIIKSLAELDNLGTLYITGHSLGAALAVLCAMDVSVNTDIDNILMCNFAGPRVGNPQFAKVYNSMIKNTLRVVNVHDIVPMLPPMAVYSPFSGQTWLYLHTTGTFHINAQSGSIAGNHSINTYIKALEK